MHLYVLNSEAEPRRDWTFLILKLGESISLSTFRIHFLKPSTNKMLNLSLITPFQNSKNKNKNKKRIIVHNGRPNRGRNQETSPSPLQLQILKTLCRSHPWGRPNRLPTHPRKYRNNYTKIMYSIRINTFTDIIMLETMWQDNK